MTTLKILYIDDHPEAALYKTLRFHLKWKMVDEWMTHRYTGH